MSCPYCPQTFTRNSNKRKHIARVHQKQTHHQPSTSTEFGMAKAMMMPEHIQISQSDVHTSRVVHETTNNFQTTIQITTTPNLIQKNSHLVDSVRPLTHKSGNNSINKSADQGFFCYILQSSEISCLYLLHCLCLSKYFKICQFYVIRKCTKVFFSLHTTHISEE